MNILFEIADKDLIFIVLGILGVILFVSVIFFAVKRGKRVKPIDDALRFDLEDELAEEKELTEEQMKAKAELERVFNQMSADLEASNSSYDTIEEFEREQEENAIISYQELIKQASIKNDESKHGNYMESKNEHKEVVQEQLDFDYEEEKPLKEEVKKFRNSDIISPIFGIQPEGRHVKQNQVPVRKNVSSSSREINNEDNNDFLNSLKEFRKNL